MAELVREGTAYLAEHGIADADWDAHALLIDLLGLDRTAYAMHCSERTVAPDDARRYRTLLARRAEHEPLQYITGKADFMGLTF